MKVIFGWAVLWTMIFSILTLLELRNSNLEKAIQMTGGTAASLVCGVYLWVLLWDSSRKIRSTPLAVVVVFCTPIITGFVMWYLYNRFAPGPVHIPVIIVSSLFLGLAVDYRITQERNR